MSTSKRPQVIGMCGTTDSHQKKKPQFRFTSNENHISNLPIPVAETRAEDVIGPRTRDQPVVEPLPPHLLVLDSGHETRVTRIRVVVARQRGRVVGQALVRGRVQVRVAVSTVGQGSKVFGTAAGREGASAVDRSRGRDRRAHVDDPDDDGRVDVNEGPLEASGRALGLERLDLGVAWPSKIPPTLPAETRYLYTSNVRSLRK
jgi:hypothetical protein